MATGFDLSIAAARPALVAGRPNVVDVLVRVQAPDTPSTGLPERPRLNLAIVIDRSGSMAGQPLHEAKRCAQFMVDGLKATDRAAVLAYDDSVQVLAPSQPVVNKERLRSAIAHLRDGGCTDLHGGWLQGAEQAAAHLDDGLVSRVLLLSDGNANRGITDVQEIASQCGQLAEKGVSTSTYGLGAHFNEQLMLEMARAGRGNGYYSETAGSLLERFREEFSLLAALCARDVRLRFKPVPGARIEMLNVCEGDQQGQWRLPDLTYEGEVWAAIRLYVDGNGLTAEQDKFALAQAWVSYRDLQGNEQLLPETWLSLPVVTDLQFESVPEDAAVIRRVREAEAARLQEEASRAAEHGDWGRVDEALFRVRNLAADNPWLGDIVGILEGLAAQRDTVMFQKEARYSASALGSRARSKFESLANFSDASAPEHLRRKARQGRGGALGEPKTSMSPDLKDAATLAYAVRDTAHINDLTPRPYNRFRPDDTIWWLVPTKNEGPWYKYGKLFFSSRPEEIGAVKADLYCGFYVEKGISPVASTVFRRHPHWVMANDWLWHAFISSMAAEFPVPKDEIILVSAGHVVDEGMQDDPRGQWTPIENHIIY